MYGATADLRVDQIGAGLSGDHRRPPSIMAGLGIDYEWSESEPTRDCFVFHGCINVPSRLPAYVRQVA